MQITPDVEARFRKYLGNPTHSGCMEWQGARLSSGYGRLWVPPSVERAHRIAWTLAHVPIPAGQFVLHRCDNPPCCNVAHLFLGRDLKNNEDMQKKGRGVYPRGEAHGRTHLTEKDVREIRVAAAEGRTFTDLGKIYKISRVAVRNIVTRKFWSHVH